MNAVMKEVPQVRDTDDNQLTSKVNRALAISGSIANTLGEIKSTIHGPEPTPEPRVPASSCLRSNLDFLLDQLAGINESVQRLHKEF